MDLTIKGFYCSEVVHFQINLIKSRKQSPVNIVRIQICRKNFEFGDFISTRFYLFLGLLTAFEISFYFHILLGKVTNDIFGSLLKELGVLIL